MSVQCRLITRTAEYEPQPGDMWFNPSAGDAYCSVEYLATWKALRPPLWVVLPNGDWFCVDSQAHKNKPHGWTVTGEAPLITVTPSIHVLQGSDAAETYALAWVSDQWRA